MCERESCSVNKAFCKLTVSVLFFFLTKFVGLNIGYYFTSCISLFVYSFSELVCYLVMCMYLSTVIAS